MVDFCLDDATDNPFREGSMTRISVELVPRDEQFLREQLELARSLFSKVDTINIPDLLQFEMRSWTACAIAQGYYPNVVPHIRAMDIDVCKPLPMSEFFLERGFTEALIISGDLPHTFARKVYPTTSLDIIKKFKRELPQIKVYAATDPYRDSLRREHDYIKSKIDAGANGFFTQPFYDFRYMDIYAHILEGVEVFWGISPVLNLRSKSYWETKNNVIFPKDFQPTLEWNREFAERALQFVADTGSSVYYMPIRTGLEKYLKGIL